MSRQVNTLLSGGSRSLGQPTSNTLYTKVYAAVPCRRHQNDYALSSVSGQWGDPLSNRAPRPQQRHTLRPDPGIYYRPGDRPGGAHSPATATGAPHATQDLPRRAAEAGKLGHGKGTLASAAQTGASVSVGARGLHRTFGRVNRTTIGQLGSGLSYTVTDSARRRSAPAGQAPTIGGALRQVVHASAMRCSGSFARAGCALVHYGDGCTTSGANPAGETLKKCLRAPAQALARLGFVGLAD